MEIQVGLHYEKHLFGQECALLVFLCLLADVLGHLFQVNLHLIVSGLKDATLIVIVYDGINDVEQIVVREMLLDVGG